MGETTNPQQPSSIHKIVPTVQKSLLCAMMLTAASVSAQTEIEADALSVNPSYDITHALQDRLAGVEVQNIGNQPGMEWQVIIRGLKSISGTAEPLLVINGVPSTQNLSSIDPSEITSIQVLKDAATTTIYGSRGKDGVILITTKTGEKNLGVKVSYNGYVGTRKVFGRYPLRSAKELMDLHRELGYMTIIPNEYPSNEDMLVGDDVDWQDRLFQTGHVNNHNLNVASGWETGSFNLNLGYVKDEGILPEEAYKRLNASFNLQQKVGSYIDFGFSARLSRKERKSNDLDVASYISLSPTLDVDADVTYDLYNYDPKFLSNEWGIWAELKCPWVEGLKYRFDGNYLTSKIEVPIRSRVEQGYALEGDENPRNHIRHYLHRLTFDRIFADKHHVLIGGQVETEKKSQRKARVTWSKDYGESLPLELNVFPKSEDDGTHHYFSYQIKYGYDKRYEVSGMATFEKGSFRRIYETVEEPYGRSYLNYPNTSMLDVRVRVFNDNDVEYDTDFTKSSKSIHAQWNVHNEAFLSEVDWIKTLSLRYDCGKIYNPRTSYFNYYYYDLSLRTISYNSNLDKYLSSNFGLDFSLWQGRLSGSVDYYTQKNYNQRILERDYKSDAFTVQNKGWEFALQGTVIDHWNGWTWSVGANLYANRNEVTEVDDSWGISKGYPIKTPYRMVYEGIWKEGDPDLEKLEGYPGDIRYKQEYEEREDGSIYAVEDHFPVSMEPKLKGGFNTHLAWRYLDLDVVGAFQIGGDVYCNWFYLFDYAPRPGWDAKNCLNLSDYWTPEHQDARYPSHRSFRSSLLPCMGWYDASMCKIRSITLGYNAEGEWLNKCQISKLRLYATVQNPFVFGSDFYKEFKMDPETNQSGFSYYNRENGQHTECDFPVIGVQSTATRNYIVGVNLEF